MTRGLQFSEYGGTDVLKVVGTPPLTAGPGQVRLARRAAGINPLDWKMMQGLMHQEIPLALPVGLGSGVAGVVDEVGTGVTELQLGDENGDDKKEPSVFATAYGGGPIEHIGVLEAWRADAMGRDLEFGFDAEATRPAAGDLPGKDA